MIIYIDFTYLFFTLKNVAIRKFKVAFVAPIMCTGSSALDKKS